MNDYQTELTEKRRSALWRALADNKLPAQKRYPTPQDSRRARRIAFWAEFGLGVLAGAALLGTMVLAMLTL
jgi:ferric-dicitrate binding protein FerR (iron transport regulator)